MSKGRTAFSATFALLTMTCGLWGQTGRVFVFPSGSNSDVTVLDATTLAAVGTITATPQAFQGFVTPDGSKYYIVSANPVHTITIASTLNLAAPVYLDAGANASTAALTPDGKYLLVSAGTLKIYSTATDTKVADLNVGSGGGSDIAVSNDSSRAYVMNTTAGRISVINLTLNPPAAATPNAFTVTSPLSMALRPDNRDLLVLVPGGLDLVNLKTGAIGPGPNSAPPTIPLFQVSTGKVVVTPDSSKAIVVNTGLSPANVSYLVDLTTQSSTQIGPANQGFSRVVIISNAKAFGIVSSNDSTNNSVAILNLASGTVPISTAVQSYGQNTLVGTNKSSMVASPSGKTLYLVSNLNSSVTRVDVASNQATSKTVGVAPNGIVAPIPPATSGASSIGVNGGDQQNVIAGQNANIPLSVIVTDSNGNPVYNAQVTFTTTETGVTLTPETAQTNGNGIAQTILSVAAPSSQTAESSSQSAESAPALSAQDGGAVNQFITTIAVQAGAPGTGVVTFSLTVSSGSGLVVISGDNQITLPGQPFAQDLVVRLTDDNGFPIANAAIDFFGSQAAVPDNFSQNTDSNGYARTGVRGGQLPFGGGLTALSGSVRASVESSLNQSVTFQSLTISTALPTGPFVSSGDMQTGVVGSTLPNFLCVNLSSNLPFLPGQIAVNWAAVSGPSGTSSASFNPPVTTGPANGNLCTQVTLGPKAGTQAIIVSASAPGLSPGTATFTLFSKPGPASRVVKVSGDNQTGKPGTLLPQRVVVQVTDKFGNATPGARVTFSVTQGSASLQPCVTTADANGNVSCPVTLGAAPGTIKIVASIGSVSVTFTETALVTAAALTAVSGNNQHLPSGGATATPVVVKVADAQGNGAPGVAVMVSGPGTVTLVPTSGTPGNPITLTSGADGTVAFKVMAGMGTPLGTLTLTANVSTGSVNLSLELTLLVDGRTPVFTANQVVNAGSFVPGMVPYGLATLFGTGLSDGFSGLALPGGATTFQGVTLKVQGVAVPLYAISHQDNMEQINFQVPSSLGTPSTVSIELNNNGSVTTVPNVPVLSVQPGIFEYTPQGSNIKYAAALKTDYSTIGPGNPISRGGVFSVYLTGGGPTLPLLGTGEKAPSSPPATTFLNPVVGIGGHGATVQFSGLAPNFVGLYQINVVVPPDAPVGAAVNLDIVIGGVASQTSHIAVQ